MISDDCGFKCHWGVADYLQATPPLVILHRQPMSNKRRHWVRTAVHLAAAGKNAVMPVIRRLSDKPYRWRVDTVGLAAVANHERKMPANFIGKDGYSITPPVVVI